MNSISQEQEEAISQIYNYAADLMLNQDKNSEEIKIALMEQGIDQEIAVLIIANLESEIEKAKHSRAKKDMLYGALWCIGGTIATLANIGFIFWGAILFGGIQFFRGLFNSLN